MSYFKTILDRNNLSEHDGRPLWGYMLTLQDLKELRSVIQSTFFKDLDPRDLTLYFAEWWKQVYNAGIPAKKKIYDSLEINIPYSFGESYFYEKAQEGAVILGINWISNKNTLYLRTLLLQGGLPLSHITENHSAYLNFLLAVLDEQPDSVIDFSEKSYIISHLPRSSQNDDIFENCFMIVKAIMNNDEEYLRLLNSHETIRNITTQLLVRKEYLKPKRRNKKPQNYWLFDPLKEPKHIHLEIDLASTYDSASLSNLFGLEIEENEYELYVNDELICKFKKMLNGDFKSSLYPFRRQNWDSENKIPEVYVMSNGQQIPIKDFIDTIPDLNEPSLWIKVTESAWRLIKGNRTSNKEGALLIPQDWTIESTGQKIIIDGKELNWLPYEGEVTIIRNDNVRKYFSDVQTFEWTIKSDSPNWVKKSNMTIVKGIPRVVVYDEEEKSVNRSKYNLSYRIYNSNDPWVEESELTSLALGCNEVRIEMGGIVAVDYFYNIGGFTVDYLKRDISQAKLAIRKSNSFDVELDATEILLIESNENEYTLKVNAEFSKIPLGIQGALRRGTQRKLIFEIESPFEGLTITNSEGKIIPPEENLSLVSLHGLRILSRWDEDLEIRFYNVLKRDVKIYKKLQSKNQPLISLRNEFSGLFYLADIMNPENMICLEIKSGEKTKTYMLSRFSHLVKDFEIESNQFVLTPNDDINLYTIPLNCTAEEIEILPLNSISNESAGIQPQQVILVSSNEGNKQLMPKFINRDLNYEGKCKTERIEDYHESLLNNDFESDIWKQVLSYFKVCKDYSIPFSTLDQLRSISRSSSVAARAFFFLGYNHNNPDEFIQNDILEIEKDLGFCFHWIDKQDWQNALHEVSQHIGNQYYPYLIQLLTNYMKDMGLIELLQFIIGNQNVAYEPVNEIYIRNLRQRLGGRVLKELPTLKPGIIGNYNIPINRNREVELLLHAPIAVAESIMGTQELSIWGGDNYRDSIRRNIQYSQYIDFEFYKNTLLHTLNRTTNEI